MAILTQSADRPSGLAADPVFFIRLAITVTLVFLPLLLYVPPWTGALLAVVLTWEFMVRWRGAKPMPPPLRLLLAGLVFAVVVTSFRTINGLSAGLPLLVAMATLKLTELRSERDLYIVTLVHIFVLAGLLLQTQAIAAVIYALCVLSLLFALLLDLSRGGARASFSDLARGIGLQLAICLPMALFLFLLFPRIEGPLWGLPAADGASTGLSGQMSPNSISSLIRSEAVAFRVAFEDTPPPPSQRYWRGPVLSHYNGRLWTAGQGPVGELSPAQLSLITGDLAQPIRYTVTLEPTGQSWLFGLDLVDPQAQPELRGHHLYRTGSLEFLSKQGFADRALYQLTSWLDYQVEANMHPLRQQHYRQLPVSFDPKSYALAADLQQRHRNPAAIASAILQRFRREPFRYTLNPPLLGRNGIDEFLFDTQAGFCEHYAAAFVVLMRAAGVPARVVTGYLGGEINPVSDYMIVRQSDAHAWAEYWQEGRGWIRVDPTGAVAPERVELGLAAALPGEMSGMLGSMSRGGDSWMRDVRLRWDALENIWNQWVLGYGPELQQAFLSRIMPALARWEGMVTALTILVMSLLGLITAVLFLRDRPAPVDPLLAAWAQLAQKLAAQGTTARRGEGPTAFMSRAAHQQPDHAEALNILTREYLALRYGPPLQQRSEAVAAFAKSVRALKLN